MLYFGNELTDETHYTAGFFYGRGWFLGFVVNTLFISVLVMFSNIKE